MAIPELDIPLDMVKELLVGFIRNEIRKAGYRKGVVGLSGGVDSALVATLSVEALGPENLLCIRLPYKSSSPTSLSDAQNIIDMLGVRSETIDITPMVDHHVETDPEMSRARKGNIMARERMIVLYDRSARHESLVIGTGNKTEFLLGYTTLYGDSACAINPIGDLYKSQVWELASYVGVPQNIIEKRPSADLWEGQTDEDELGLAYKTVDQLLHFLVDERLSQMQIMEKGFEKPLITKVRNMIQRNQFKRRLPVIAKIDPRTAILDDRYTRD